jgi:hypothetical protein
LVAGDHAGASYARLTVGVALMDDREMSRARDRVGRRRWAGSRASLIVAVALSVCSLVLVGVRSGAADAAENPIGAHSMLQLNSPFAFMQTMFAEAAGMHAAAIRLDVAPALVFADPSRPPDFSGLDEVMALSRQYHVRVIADLFTVPWWIAACQAPTGMAQMTHCGTDDLVGYRSVITQIVARADPVIRDWEIWNEPDQGASFTGTPAQYAQMLRAAHDAIKGVDLQANVLLGGISGVSGMSWLAQVFAAPGADAVHAFDIANVHERNRLDALGTDVASWKRWLTGYGFAGPLWVTEHGYPADPAFQYDPSFSAGPVSQAAYLTASIPTLIDAGAAEVFVTERDNLGGQYASEGLLGGDVFDPPVADPQPVQRPAYTAVTALADCYASLGRDCPGAGPVASPPLLTMLPTRLGTSRVAAVSVSDPGPEPLQLGAVAIVGNSPDPIAVQRDGCSNQLLEPDRRCTLTVRFKPIAGGAAAATLSVPSENGTLSIAVTAVSPSVSSLTSPQLASPTFTPAGSGNGVGDAQRLVLNLRNPLGAPVHVADATLSGSNARPFWVQPDDCAGVDLAPNGRCLVYVLFIPTEPGTATALLTLHGSGTPLSVILRATAFGPPRVSSLAAVGPRLCFAPTSGNRVVVATDQRATVRWRVVREPHRIDRRCLSDSRPAAVRGVGGRSSASGRVRTAAHPAAGQVGEYLARFALPLDGGRRGLLAGAYRLTVTAGNAHGSGAPRTAWLTVLP